MPNWVISPLSRIGHLPGTVDWEEKNNLGLGLNRVSGGRSDGHCYFGVDLCSEGHCYFMTQQGVQSRFGVGEARSARPIGSGEAS